MAAVDVVCPHCNRRQKVPEHRLTGTAICLLCQQIITDPWQYKVEPEKIELAIKLKGRIVSEFGTTKLDEVRSKADDYTGHANEQEFAGNDDADKPHARGNTSLMFESGMYAAPYSGPRLSTAAKTYIVAGVVISILTGVVVGVGIMLLGDGARKTDEIHASGGEGERIELYPGGTVKAKWNVTDENGIEQEHGAYLEFYIGGSQKTVGSFVHGERAGTWTRWHENGKKSDEISYLEGKEHGAWAEWHDNGRKSAEGLYASGQRDGEWRTWHKDGRPASFSRYEDGAPVGEWLEFHRGGERRSHGMYQSGFKEGRWIYWRENGSVELGETWKGGVLDGATFGEHRDGIQAFRGYWEKGLRAGTWSWWHQNGELKRRGDYKDDKETATWREWHSNGLLKEQGNYTHGRRQGMWEEFDENGDLVARREYNNDRVISENRHLTRK